MNNRSIDTESWENIAVCSVWCNQDSAGTAVFEQLWTEETKGRYEVNMKDQDNCRIQDNSVGFI